LESLDILTFCKISTFFTHPIVIGYLDYQKFEDQKANYNILYSSYFSRMGNTD